MGWQETDLSSDPILVVGLRNEKRAVEGFRVNLDSNVAPHLQKVAADTLGWIKSREPVEYTPYVDPQEDEYLTLATETLPTKPAKESKTAASEKEETAVVVALIRDSDVLPEIGAGKLSKRLEDGALYLQAICLSAGEERIGFITKARSQQVMKRSSIPLGKNDQNDRLKRIARPELVLESDIHAIVSPQEIAILNRNQFQHLVSDVPLVFGHVPVQIERIADTFKGRGVQLSSATEAAILAEALRSIRVAKRLEAFAERIRDIDISRITNGDGFTDQDLVAADFVNSSGEIACQPERVAELLDALEGRFFGDAFSTEKRRADRFRKR
jgi:hypothetical protein